MNELAGRTALPEVGTGSKDVVPETTAKGVIVAEGWAAR